MDADLKIKELLMKFAVEVHPLMETKGLEARKKVEEIIHDYMEKIMEEFE